MEGETIVATVSITMDADGIVNIKPSEGVDIFTLISMIHIADNMLGQQYMALAAGTVQSRDRKKPQLLVPSKAF